jgi:drug/metabolite transporter (DMT)-like permease
VELWIPITIFAAFMQNLRSALQKKLKAKLSDGGATYVRFFYAWPFAVAYCWALVHFGGYVVPTVNHTFLLYCLAGGVSQIVFTFLLLYLFSFHNFAVGTVYSKTEIIQVAFLGLILLGDKLTASATAAIALSAVGVIALSAARTKVTLGNLFTGLTYRPTLIGLICGAFLGASVVFFRGGALALGDGDFIIRAAFTLVVSVVIQTAIMTVYLKTCEPGQITEVLRNWPVSLAVGIAGVLGSIGWFTAFTIQSAAYVRALGQIELIFTFIASLLFFRERTTPRELFGIGLIVTAILMLVLAE